MRLMMNEVNIFKPPLSMQQPVDTIEMQFIPKKENNHLSQKSDERKFEFDLN